MPALSRILSGTFFNRSRGNFRVAGIPVLEMNTFQHSLKKAQIVDLASGRVIVTYPIEIPAHNSPSSEWEMMERAWCYAVEDGITRSESRGKFSVRIVPIEWMAPAPAELADTDTGSHV